MINCSQVQRDEKTSEDELLSRNQSTKNSTKLINTSLNNNSVQYYLYLTNILYYIYQVLVVLSILFGSGFTSECPCTIQGLSAGVIYLGRLYLGCDIGGLKFKPDGGDIVRFRDVVDQFENPFEK